MNGMPEDVIMDILSRLPVRQLVSYRCVCKAWYALIKSSAFIDMHLSLQPAKCNELFVIPHYDIVRGKDVVSFYKHDSDSLGFFKAQADIEIKAESKYRIRSLNHCNGIIYISSFHTDILMNPALGQLEYLPRIPALAHLKEFFDGVHHPPKVGTGFGCNYAKKDYKVVRLYGIPSEEYVYSNWEAYIYDLKTSNSWRKLEAKPTFSYEIRGIVDKSLFFKGLVHWVTLDMQKQPKVLTFNMSTELFGEIQLPENNMGLGMGMCPFKLFAHDKSIAFCNHGGVDGGHSEVMNVWVMKEYGIRESWTKLYSFSMPTKSWALSFWKNDKIFLYKVIYSTIIGCMVRPITECFCYDLLTGKVDEIHQFIDATKLLVCAQSLVSINQTVKEPGFASWGKKKVLYYVKKILLVFEVDCVSF